MILESWKWLIQLKESGSFTRASEELQISQQTLSSRLATLERELGCKLMVRTTPLTLTRAGEVFMAFAEESEAARTDALRRMGEVTLGGAGRLKVGVSNIRGQVLMPYVITEFHKSLPGVDVRLVEGTNEELVRMAEREEVDLALGCFDGAHPGVEVRRLFSEQVVCVMDPALLEAVTGLDAPTAVAELAAEGIAALRDCPFLLATDDDVSGRIGRAELRLAGIKPDPVVESGNMMTLLALCQAGLGAVFCPTNVLDQTPSVAGGLLRIPLSESARYDISVGTPRAARAWMPAQVFEDVIGTLFGEPDSFDQPEALAS